MKVDGSDYVGRVIFDDVSDLGVVLPKYTIGDVITVENEVAEIVIYNALEFGTLTFTISFSGAAQIALYSASLVAALALTGF